MTTYDNDDDLGFSRSRTIFEEGDGLSFDEAYRLAHLPLVAPRHPGVIAAKAGAHYEMGRHPTVYSLVLPIAAEELEEAPAFRALEAAIRASPFASKIAFDILPRRRAKLHATICGGFGTDEPPRGNEERFRKLRDLGSIEADIRGLFSGNVNRGRLYLKVYPEKRKGGNALHLVQEALGRPRSDLYVVGLWNLTEELDAGEAAALKSLIETWWDRSLLQIEVRELWLLGSRDDLVLDSDVIARLPLV